MVKEAYIVAGPTASGKSDFAHSLAKRVNGVIINCDSVQIYKGIECISASPFAGVENPDKIVDGIPYKLFSIIPLAEQMSVVDYLNMARHEYLSAISEGRTPIFVGGSGYYIGIILNGISPIPEISPENRMRARDLVRDCPDAVQKLLPEDFILKDPQRTSRAVEVFLETGRSLSEWQKLPRKGAIRPTPFKVFINPHRDIMIERIKQRLLVMLQSGALEEAKKIMKSELNEMRAIGLSELCKLAREEISEDECISNWAIRTCQYAKRQRTWFKNQYAADYSILHVPTENDLNSLVEK